MAWFAANWFWALIFIAIIAMHTFGHGFHGGHRGHSGPGEGDRQGGRDEGEKDEAQIRDMNTRSGGHRH